MSVRCILAAVTVLGVLGTAGAVTAAIATKPQPAPKPAQGAVPWLPPADTIRWIRAAGLRPERKETLIHHVHAHLDIFVNGKPAIVPAGIGINIHDPGVKRFREPDGSTAYGGIELCKKPCISPLHTHDESGVIHTESSDAEPHTLGQFFVEWGALRGDPRAIEITDRKVIVIVVGTPPAVISSTADFSDA
jgi:hypothetical protein